MRRELAGEGPTVAKRPPGPLDFSEGSKDGGAERARRSMRARSFSAPAKRQQENFILNEPISMVSPLRSLRWRTPLPLRETPQRLFRSSMT